MHLADLQAAAPTLVLTGRGDNNASAFAAALALGAERDAQTAARLATRTPAQVHADFLAHHRNAIRAIVRHLRAVQASAGSHPVMVKHVEVETQIAARGIAYHRRVIWRSMGVAVTRAEAA